MLLPRTYRVGLLGFGNVMQIFLKHYFSVQETVLKQYGFSLEFVAICDSKSIISNKKLDVAELIRRKEKGMPLGREKRQPLKEFVRTLKDSGIKILVDGLPSSKIDEGPSFPVLAASIKRGVTVICVNKSPLVFKGEKLYDLAKKYRTRISTSATTAGALPSSGIIMNELAGAEISSIRGVLNGTSNYILERMMYDGYTLNAAVNKAKEMGIAEPDYRFDLEGTDTCFKMIILALLLTGKQVPLKKIPCTGILNLKLDDIRWLAKQGKAIRLIGNLAIRDKTPFISVAPEVLDCVHPLFNVHDTQKGVMIETKYMGNLTIIGGASGRIPIAATILKDIINICKQI